MGCATLPLKIYASKHENLEIPAPDAVSWGVLRDFRILFLLMSCLTENSLLCSAPDLAPLLSFNQTNLTCLQRDLGQSDFKLHFLFFLIRRVFYIFERILLRGGCD